MFSYMEAGQSEQWWNNVTIDARSADEKRGDKEATCPIKPDHECVRGSCSHWKRKLAKLESHSIHS